ncbi:TatD family hydrolase [Halothiobacillus sp. DCM-1]|uniref:TatD family hydrolase n=1 Tax=Halothiobacillus sp. DCM-1 TaxID=3112558 RepID=UPI0032476F94
MIDTHCHLDALLARCPAAPARWLAAGVHAVITMGTHPDQWSAAEAAAQSAHAVGSRVGLALGVHPWWVEQVAAAEIPTRLTAAIAAASLPVVAIGEIGLDAVHAPATLPAQQALLAGQLAVAEALRLPVVLHERKTADLLSVALRRHPGLTGVVHGFTGSRQQAERLIEAGFCLGVGAALTHPRANRLRSMLAALPVEALLLESDAPFQPGAAHLGAVNEPAFLPETLRALAALRGLAPDSLAATLDANARRVFGPVCAG